MTGPTPIPACLFIVDDDADHLAALCDLAGAAGYRFKGFSDGATALLACQSALPDALVTDLRMPGMDGIALLQAVRAKGWDLPILMITGHGDVTHAVRAIQAGAEDFLEKPYDSQHLLMVLARILQARATRAELARLQALLGKDDTPLLLGESSALNALRARIALLAPLPVDVVIIGDTGTGKELVAHALHQTSNRSAGPFHVVNCAALPEALFEIEMFGHAEGAFPGAGAARAGRIEATSGGTLVLDEIESLPLAMQAKLLRVLGERMVQRLGDVEIRPLDLRLITISKTDLRLATQLGGFRADLYYRLAGAEITTPQLRQTGNDIVLLYSHFASASARRNARPPPEISFALRRDLMRRPWPGNVRELRNAAEAHALGLSTPLTPQSMDTTTQSTGSLAERVAGFEAREIAAVLDKCRGNAIKAAEILQMPRRTLADKIRRYGLKLQT
ncbi:MAG: sigma-54 dependent transcriptional regulator [Cypionkella sp.]|uniref:sigma-54-dependent transcriptional regulator n=1 Tax=Cypionkella sp. TaxID=2811411 RepID=UPI002AB80283|nr:sigma-54 dependent transcriptional regulator [Cypionkella sp.]MDZ4309504.1 sigma-54 dependent transcriptional regulator [Cypionkella sp.]MDZ4392883.1 sigma-54 dependent transcriptional regulator [Cypionkella sp.]